MQIPKELIEKAKETLGDRNFRIICENYGVPEGNRDDRAMKCNCVFHEGDHTPSLVYNRRDHYMHCFACQKTVDILDSYMYTGMTYIEACKKLFAEAEVQFAFGEHKVPTYHNYRYPVVPPKENDRTKVISYWKTREIAERTLDYCDIRADEYGNSVFITYDLNDVPTVVKYKPTDIPRNPDKPKCWFQKNADKKDILFNMNRANTSEPLLICEGEPDVLAAVEAGYTNAVSPLNGSTSFGWVSECWDFLDQFQEIIVAGDHDEAGNKMNQELVFRLGSWRTKIADIPEEYTNPITEKTYHIKDINEYLYWAGKRAVYEAIVNAKDTPVKSVVDISEVQDIDIDQMDGIETGFREIDRELYKIFYSTVTLISGRPGAGKSSLTNAIIANAMEQDIPCFLFSKEMPERIVKNWLVSQIAGSGHIYERVSQNGNVYYNVDPQSKLKIDAWMKNKLYLYRDNEPNDVDSLVTSMTDCVRKFGTRLMVIDNLMCIDLGGASDKLESQKQFIVKLVDFSIKMGVAVILVAHPRKRQPGESAEADVSLDDIAGSSDLTNMCHRSISLRRIGKREHEEGKSEFSKYNVKLVCTKDRILGKADVEFGLYYDIPSRRFFSSYEEYARAYSWDDKASELNLPIPRCLLDERYSDADEEVFGSVS